MEEKDAIRRALDRERKARKEAERILEEKSALLYESNEKLQRLNTSLERQVEERTLEIKKGAEQSMVMFENNPIPMMVYRLSDFKFLEVNQVAVSNYGYTREEFLQMKLTDLYPKGQITDLEAHLDTIRPDVDEVLEWQHVTKSGELIYVEISSTSLDFNDEPSWLVLIKDITERKQAEWKRAENEKKYRDLVEHASDIIFRCNVKGEFVYVNPTCEHKTGYTEKELIGKSFADLVRPDYQEKVRLFYRRQFEAGEISSYLEFPVITKTGEEFWIGQRVDLHLLEGESEGFDIVALSRDVTDKIRAQEALQRSEEKYRSIIENLELGLLEVDNDDVILNAYPKFCDLTGYSREELIGKKGSELLLPDDYRERMLEQNKNRLVGQPAVYEMPLNRKDGEQIWVMISGAPYYDHMGKVVGSVGIHLDITDRKRADEELKLAKETAENSVRSKERFMANMSHEIRTPMNAIIGMSELLSKSQLDAKQKEFLNAISTSADNLLIIINDILDFSKIEAGKLALELIPTDLKHLLKNCLLTVQLKAEEKGLILKSQISDELKTYSADPTRLGQVIINLLSNAVKFTEKGEVKLTCKRVVHTDEYDELFFSVRDTGIGISEDTMDLIFESFIQAEQSTARRFGGTGLGLPISRQLVNMMGSDIQVSSKLGIGTEFHFSLRLNRADEPEKSIRPSESSDPISLENKKILLVEDNEINRFMAQTILENWKCRVTVAMNGLEAIDMVSRTEFDLVLMDMSMPIMDGKEATIHIRKELKSKVPIIGLTANAIKGDREMCLAVGMDDYVSKPFKQDELLEKMGYLLTGSVSPERIQEEPTEVISHESLMDLSKLEISTNGDKDFMKRMIQLFLDDAPNHVARFKEAADKDDKPTIGKIAHSMKPSIDHLANTHMQALIRQLEDSETANGSHLSLLDEFLCSLEQLSEELQNHI